MRQNIFLFLVLILAPARAAGEESCVPLWADLGQRIAKLQLHLTPATRDDTPAIREFVNRLLKIQNRWIVREFVPDNFLDSIRQHRGEVLVIKDDAGKIVATAGYARNEKSPANSTELTTVYVDPSQRGRGLGRALVLELMERARATGHTHMSLAVYKKGEEALGLYQSLGFTMLPAENQSYETVYLMDRDL